MRHGCTGSREATCCGGECRRRLVRSRHSYPVKREWQLLLGRMGEGKEWSLEDIFWIRGGGFAGGVAMGHRERGKARKDHRPGV